MKSKFRKFLTVAAMLTIMTAMSGCGSSTKVMTGEPAQEAGAADAGTGATEQAKDSTQESAPADSLDGYAFAYENLEMMPDMDAAGTIAALGEAKSYFEAESCAFHGLDKMYTYSGFEVDTYPKDGRDYISNIILKDDTVSTKEGVSLYMTKEDMVAAYGENYTEDSGVCSYEKGGMKLCFIFSGEEIHAIEYRSKVLESE